MRKISLLLLLLACLAVSVRADDLTLNLTSYWSLDGGSYDDYYGVSNLTDVGNVHSEAVGLLAEGAHFTDTSGGLYKEDWSSVYEETYNGWFKGDTGTFMQSMAAYSWGSIEWIAYFNPGGGVAINTRVTGGGGDLNWYNTDAGVNGTAWNMVTLVFNKTHMRIWVDGLSSVGWNAFGGTRVIGVSGNDFGFSKIPSNAGMVGFADELGYWKRMLTESEITSLFNGRAGLNPTVGGAAPVPEMDFFLYANSTLLSSIKEWQQFRLVVQHSLDNGSLLPDSSCTGNVTNGSLMYSDTFSYNSSLSAYRGDNLFSYFSHCASCLVVAASCDNPNDDYDLSSNKAFAINNLAPMPMLAYLVTPDKAYFLDDGYEVNYSDGVYNVNATPYNTAYEIDNDIVKSRWELRNRIQVLKSDVNSSYADFSFNSVLVVRNGTYNVSLWLNDSNNAQGYQSTLFWTRDYTLPLCSGLADVTISNGTYFMWNISCTDDYLYSFNLTCGNGFSFNKTMIANTTYNVSRSVFVSTGADFSCDYEYCDGHTAMLIEPMDINPIGKEGIIDVEGIQLNVREQVNAVRLNKEFDRYSFCYDFADAKQAYATVPIPEGCFPALNSKWKGHLVCPEQHIWIDFENPDVKVSIANDEVILDLAQARDKADVCFDSIGKWNCVSGSQAFTVLIPEKNSTSRFEVGYCPDTEPGALIIGIVIFFLFGILVLGVSLRIPVFAYAAGLGLIVVSFTMAGCSAFIGVCFLVIGLISILVGTQV